LRVAGRGVRVYELQGDLLFPAIEAVVCAVVDAGDELAIAVLDLKRVTDIGGPAARILFDLITVMHDRGQRLVMAGCERHGKLLRHLDEQRLAGDAAWRLLCQPDLDSAVEWCENQLIAAHGGPSPAPVVPPSDNDLLRGLAPAAIETLEALLAYRSFAAGEYIVSHGDQAEALYLITSGQVTVALPSVLGQPKRLSTLTAGMCFGELALVDGGTRSADVIARTRVECRMLSVAAFRDLGASHPQIENALLKNMLRSAHEIVHRLSQEVTALGG
jgi:glutaminase